MEKILLLILFGVVILFSNFVVQFFYPTSVEDGFIRQTGYRIRVRFFTILVFIIVTLCFILLKSIVEFVFSSLHWDIVISIIVGIASCFIGWQILLMLLGFFTSKEFSTKLILRKFLNERPHLEGNRVPDDCLADIARVCVNHAKYNTLGLDFISALKKETMFAIDKLEYYLLGLDHKNVYDNYVLEFLKDYGVIK